MLPCQRALFDMPRIAAALRKQGAALLVDATHDAGVRKIDVKTLDPDFLIFPTYKWVLGPYGRAFMYVAKRRQNGMPLEQTAAAHFGPLPPQRQREGDALAQRQPGRACRDELVRLVEALMAGLEAHLSLLRVTLQTWVRDRALSITRQVISQETCSCDAMENLPSAMAC